MARILAIAPHADDETLGCGGTLLRWGSNDDEIFWLIVTAPIDQEKKPLVSNSIAKVSSAYGFKSVTQLGIPETEVDCVPMVTLVSKISEVVKEVQPETIFLPNRADVHSDHRIIFDAAYSCTKNFRYPFVRRLLVYETLSETEFAPSLPGHSFVPNIYVNVTDFLARKIEIMNMYEGEVMEAPLPRSNEAIRALAGYRGSRIGVPFAEAFMLIFESM